GSRPPTSHACSQKAPGRTIIRSASRKPKSWAYRSPTRCRRRYSTSCSSFPSQPNIACRRSNTSQAPAMPRKHQGAGGDNGGASRLCHARHPCSIHRHEETTRRRAGRCWGLCRRRHLVYLKVHVWIPALEDGTQLPVEGLHTRLQQQMRPFFGPLHLLFFTEAFAHHLIHRGLHKTCRDRLSIVIPLPVIRDQVSVVPDIRAQRRERLNQGIEPGIRPVEGRDC